MHTNPEVWGPDAQHFVPERWDKLRPGFNYLPFNAGPRICIGQQFALAETAYVVVRLLQKFDAIDGSAVPKGRLPCEWKLVDRVAEGLKVRFHSRELDEVS
jgi:cytochrome P450